MADNKIEDALEKAGDILDSKLNSNTTNNESNNESNNKSNNESNDTPTSKIIPTITYTVDGNVSDAGSFKLGLSIVANDYKNVPVKVIGKVLGKVAGNCNIKSDDIAVDTIATDGAFQLVPLHLNDCTKEFEISLSNDYNAETFNIRFDIVRESDSIVLNHIEISEPVEYTKGMVTFVSGKNCDGAKLFITDETENEYTFDSVLKFPFGTKLSVSVEKTHYITDKQIVTVTKEPQEIQIDLKPANYKLQIINSFEADTIDIHVGDAFDNNLVHYVEPLTFEYGTKLTVEVTKKGYKTKHYVIETINEDTVIDIDAMERVRYSLMVKSPINSVVNVNGTVIESNTVWPLTFDEGTNIELTVTKNHYETFTSKFVMNEDKVFDIVLPLEKHTLTVITNPSAANVTLAHDGINNTNCKQLTVPYGASVKLKAEHEGYDTVNKTIVISGNTTETITLEKKQLTLTIDSKKPNVLVGATIAVNGVIINNNNQKTNKAKVTYGEENTVHIAKPGYPSITTSVICTEDTTIYVDAENEWKKPQVTVNISNKQDIVNPIVITVNGNAVSENSPVDIDFNTIANIVVSCDGYKTITESKLITTDYNPYYELVDVNSDKVKLDVICELEGAKVLIAVGTNADSDAIQLETTSLYVVPDNDITVTITHAGYETVTDTFRITEDTVKEYSLDMFKPKNFKLTVTVVPDLANVELVSGNTVSNNKSITVPYLSNVTVKATGAGYLPYEKIVEITKDTELSITLEEDPEYNGDLTDTITLEKIIEMIKFRNSYSYLMISRVFKLGGYTEETVRAFYNKFGSYCTSRYDFKLWDMMHKYFGHDNIPHPDTKE